MTRRPLVAERPTRSQIGRMQMSLPRYALSVPVFRFRNLASLAGRAPIGGAREVALGCFVAARMSAAVAESPSADATGRIARCAGAKAWFGTLALPPAIRACMLRCADVTVHERSAAVGREVRALAAASAAFLDAPSRGELEALAASLCT